MKLALLTAVTSITLALAAPKQEVFIVPDCPLDLKMAVEILADYDVRHQPQIEAGQYWGLTIPERKTILISDEPSIQIRKEIVLHELLHACRRVNPTNLPDAVEEAAVRSQAKDMYMALFGGK